MADTVDSLSSYFRLLDSKERQESALQAKCVYSGSSSAPPHPPPVSHCEPPPSLTIHTSVALSLSHTESARSIPCLYPARSILGLPGLPSLFLVCPVYSRSVSSMLGCAPGVRRVCVCACLCVCVCVCACLRSCLRLCLCLCVY